MTNLLDNPVWNALQSNNQNLALGVGAARYYLRDVAPFAGVAEYTSENFTALYHLITDDLPVAIFTVNETIDPGPWRQATRIDGYQMVFAPVLQPRPADATIVPLTEQHIPDMLALTQLTNPGPFLKETIRFGHYEGVFFDNRLVAMAGQRFHTGTYAEISAVCTDPGFTGRGLARKLILNQIQRIQARNETPYLHVKSENDRALQVYKDLGFAIRSKIFIHILKKPL